LIAEIVSNDTSSITVADNLDAVLQNGVTPFEIRPYWTLATAFPAGAGLKTGTSATLADTLTIIDPATATGNAYFYSSSANQWRRGSTDSSAVIIPPGSGIMVTRKDAAAVSIQISGEVITSAIMADAGGSTATLADTVTIFDPATGTGSAYFYNSSANQWRRGSTDSSNVTIPEGAAVMITRKANRGAFEWYIPSPIATINQ
jgi:hypothetical protein